MRRKRCGHRYRSGKASGATRLRLRWNTSTGRYAQRSAQALQALQAFDEHDLRVAGAVEILERAFHAIVAAVVERARRLVYGTPGGLDIDALAAARANVPFDRIDEKAPNAGTLRARVHGDPVEIPATVGHLDR